MTDRRQHAAAAYALLHSSMEGNATDGAWALSLAATRLRQAGDAGLAEQVEELADGWCPADSEIRAVMARVEEMMK